MGEIWKFPDRSGVLKLKRRKRRAPLPTTSECTVVRSAHPRHIVEGSDRTIRVERPARGQQPREVNLPPRQRSEEHGVRGAAAGARGEEPGAKFFIFEISFDRLPAFCNKNRTQPHANKSR